MGGTVLFVPERDGPCRRVISQVPNVPAAAPHAEKPHPAKGLLFRILVHGKPQREASVSGGHPTPLRRGCPLRREAVRPS